MLATGRNSHDSSRENRGGGNRSGHDHQTIRTESESEFFSRRHGDQIGPRRIEGDLTRRVITPSASLHSRPLYGQENRTAASRADRVGHLQFIHSRIRGADGTVCPVGTCKHRNTVPIPLVGQRSATNGVRLEDGGGSLQGPDTDRFGHEGRGIHHGDSHGGCFDLTYGIDHLDRVASGAVWSDVSHRKGGCHKAVELGAILVPLIGHRCLADRDDREAEGSPEFDVGSAR